MERQGLITGASTVSQSKAEMLPAFHMKGSAILHFLHRFI
jgi:hypothetical protein